MKNNDFFEREIFRLKIDNFFDLNTPICIIFHAQCICDAYICIRDRFWRFLKNAKKSSSWCLNFQLWLWDFSAAWRDLKLKLRLNTATSISFWGSGCWANPSDKRGQVSKTAPSLTPRSGRLTFHICPDCGERFAPYIGLKYDIHVHVSFKYNNENHWVLVIYILIFSNLIFRKFENIILIHISIRWSELSHFKLEIT